jgi:hypothetical protein
VAAVVASRLGASRAVFTLMLARWVCLLAPCLGPSVWVVHRRHLWADVKVDGVRVVLTGLRIRQMLLHRKL